MNNRKKYRLYCAENTLHIIFLSAVFLFFSCEKQTDWDIKSKPNDYLVVDGIITNELKNHVLRLSRTVNELNMPAPPVSGAQVFISDGDSIYYLTENPQGSGLYLTDSLFIASTGKNYQLTIIVESKIYSSSASMEPVTPFSVVSFSKNTKDTSLYEVNWTKSQFGSSEPAMWELLIDWSHLPGYDSVSDESCKARMLFYTLKTMDVNQAFAPAKENVLFPKGSKVIQKKYSLTEQHSEFIRTLLYETEWHGGLFDATPANVITNLSEGAIGFFGACSVIKSDTVKVE